MVCVVENVPQKAVVIAQRAAEAWLRDNQQEADEGALYECLKSWVEIKFPFAARQARELFKAEELDLAIEVFDAAMIEAGEQAAQEAGWPCGFNAELACA